jgi:cytidine deaminase
VDRHNIDRRAALLLLGGAGLGLTTVHLSAHSQEPNTEALRKLLAGFSEKSLTILAHALQDRSFSGSIAHETASTLLQNEKFDSDALMLALLPLAPTFSRPPISRYLVGVVARGESGNLYFGANFEVPGQGLGFSIHGEQSALSNAYMHGEHSVTSLAVTAAPCGHCRQFMYEMSPDGGIRILVSGKPPQTLSSLLPAAFGPRDLGATDGAFPVRKVSLELKDNSSDPLVRAALDAARQSYAPYTKSHSGVAIATRDGHICQGSYIENAAFNPSLPPLQTALTALILSGKECSEISRVALVEIENATISQKSVSDATLSTTAPGVQVERFTAHAI